MKEREKKDRPSENKNVLWRGTREITDLIRRMRFRVCGFIELTQCVCVCAQSGVGLCIKIFIFSEEYVNSEKDTRKAMLEKHDDEPAI